MSLSRVTLLGTTKSFLEYTDQLATRAVFSDWCGEILCASLCPWVTGNPTLYPGKSGALVDTIRLHPTSSGKPSPFFRALGLRATPFSELLYHLFFLLFLLQCHHLPLINFVIYFTSIPFLSSLTWSSLFWTLQNRMLALHKCGLPLWKYLKDFLNKLHFSKM